ncbi:MAG: ATP-dependent DNA helicase, partial [Planctomycetota bacterium]
MHSDSSAARGAALLSSFCLVAATATSEHPQNAQALEWAALKPAAGSTAGSSTRGAPEPFWRGVRLHPDDVPLFRRLEMGAAFEALRRQGRSIHEAFGDLLVFAAGAPIVCVDAATATLLRRMGRGLIRQPVFSLQEVAAVAAPLITAPTLEGLQAALMGGAPAVDGADAEEVEEAGPPQAAPSDLDQAPAAAQEAVGAAATGDAVELPHAGDATHATHGAHGAHGAGKESGTDAVLDASRRARLGWAVWERLQGRLRALPLPVLTEINFLPGIGLHPIQELLRAAEKQSLGGANLGVLEGPGADPVGPRSKAQTLEGLWKDFSAIVDPKSEDRMGLGRGFSIESAAAEERAAETAAKATGKPSKAGGTAGGGPSEPPVAPVAPVAPVEEAEIRAVFAPDGPLSRVFKNYEMREEQVEMAVAVGAALSDGRHLVVEAGTGTGKSLAYLVPAVLFSLRNHTPVVISTHTKTLQGQLMNKDLPILRKALGKVFKAALLKGRSNYLCLRKFNELLRGAQAQLEPDEYEPMPGVVSWAAATPDGDVEGLATFDAARDWRLWSKLHTVGADCLGRKCRYFTRCFVFKARGEARMAHVVIANHALVFASLNREQGALPPLKHVIFDEAHALEDVATDFLSVEFDRVSLIRQLNRFSREGGGGGGGAAGG